MQLNKILVSLLVLLCFVPSHILAASYTPDEVSLHASPDDCWMIFEDGVYDITSYLDDHDRYLEIESWCGQDMTEDFKDKAGVDRDHKMSSYSLLEGFRIGDINDEKNNNVLPTEFADEVESNDIPPTIKGTQYYVGLLIIITLIIYWGWYFLCKRNYQCSVLKLTTFNFFWNTILLITLIPAVGFGIFMAIRANVPALYSIDFDFLFWHVEGGIIMGTVAISHFLTRINAYIAQLKVTLRRTN